MLIASILDYQRCGGGLPVGEIVFVGKKRPSLKKGWASGETCVRGASGDGEGFEPGAVDVDHFEELDHTADGHRPGERPIDDFEIVETVFHPVENAIEQEIAVENQFVNLPEFVFREFFPALLALDMFEAFNPTEGEPVFAEPVFETRFALIAAMFLAFDPLVFQGFL